MLRYAADENFNNDIVWGLLRRNTELDFYRFAQSLMIYFYSGEP